MLVYDPNTEDQEDVHITNSASTQSTPNVIKRVGVKEKKLGSCTFSCLSHSYDVICAELNKYAATVSKAVVAGQVIKAMAKKAPKAIAKILKRDSIADALGAVISAAAGNVVSIGSVEWDQSLPVVRDQKMWTFKGGMTSWKPSRDAAGLTTSLAVPRYPTAAIIFNMR
ncbi:hypothetical protein [Natrinema sp. SYSU A 869]|uniref:hypothetical protein n=1 Tax=Natrinema sp. SYSU A 869 TaxID=2871694 RepID=UPI001CA3E5E5|nr:hypothetical protein [Natrinema sp. SYSU A 869]